MGIEDQFAADPARFIKQAKELRSKIILPHPGQREVIDSPAQFKVINAGRRWGKTMVGVKMMVDHARHNPGSLCWWVAPTYKVVKRGYNQTLKQLPRELITHRPPEETAFEAGRSVTLKFKNGSRIEYYSAERPEGMLGEGVDLVIQDEAASTPSTVWEQIIRSTLLDTGGKGVLISTPRGRNWFYRRWLMGQDPEEPLWASWTFPSASNPHITQAGIDAMIAELPAVLIGQEVNAEFLVSGSNVFRWEQIQPGRVGSDGLVEGVEPRGHVFLGIDLAKTHDFTVLYGAQDSDLMNVYFERFNEIAWSEQKRRIRRAVNKIESQPGVESVTLIMDKTGVGDPIVEEIEEGGYDVVGVNFTSTKAKMVSQLGKDLEHGRAVLLGDAFLHEFENYEMNATPKGVLQFSAPEGEFDDVVTAKMLSHWGMTQEGVPSVENITGDNVIDYEPRAYDSDEDELDDEDFSYLIDEEEDQREALIEAQRDMFRRPTTAELLNMDSVWN